jgi:N-acetylglucosamine kinase-like BadF-type ATPase
MILIADSGSTKTDWLLIDKENTNQTQSIGLNPYHINNEFFTDVLKNEVNHKLKIQQHHINEVYFYGAGCGAEQKQKEVKSWLSKIYTKANIEVASDLLAAARAVCMNRKGIVVILGTGSNSCIFDGEKITDTQISLGYILGDEGSGAYLGKILLKDVLEEKLPQHLIQKFYKDYPLSLNEILDNIYNKPFANRFLAGFTKFIGNNIDDPSLQKIVKNAFNEFINRYLHKYNNYLDYKVYGVGSVAWYFKDIFINSCLESGLICENIMLKPMEGLKNYHSKKLV